MTDTNLQKYRYRLLEGQHVEPVPGTDNGRLIKRGEIFESEFSWYAERWPEKFEEASPRLEASGFVWNKDQETLEQFNQRMGQMQEAERKEQQRQQQQVVADAARKGFNTNAANVANTKNLRPEDMEALSAMTITELKQYAAEEEIDLKGASKKEDILRLILQGQHPTTV